MHKPLFHLFGFPVIVQWPFYLVMALLGTLIVGGTSGPTGPDEFILVGLFFVAGFISIIAHELGHAFTGRHYGAYIPAIVLHAFGGLCYFEGKSFSRKESIIVTAAGPAAGLLLALVAYLLLIGLQDHVISPETGNLNHLGFFLFILVFINLLWSIFNLFPIIPMDGGQIMRQIIGPNRLHLALQISLFTAIALAIISFLTFKMLILPLYLGWMAWENWQMMQKRYR